MIRVLVIDDEYLVRERVKRCIDWEQLGFEIVGEAENGREALELMEKFKPLLVVTDINMPYVDGLEFSKALKIRYPECKIIILTGYDYFEYARTAINVGVYRYLLKPINQDELQRIVSDIREQIEQEDAVASRLEMMRTNERTLQSVQRERLFADIVSAEHAPNAIALSAFAKQFCTLLDGSLYVFLFEIRYSAGILDRPGEKDLWRFAVENVVSEVFEPVASATVNDQDYRMALIVNPMPLYEIATLISLCVKVQEYVRGHFGIVLTIGVSGLHTGFGSIPDAWQEAVAALENRVIWGTGSVIPYAQILYGPSPLATSRVFRDALLINLRLGNMEQIAHDLHVFMAEAQTKKRSVETLRMVISDIFFSLASFVGEAQMDVSDLFEGKSTMDNILWDKDDLTQVEASLTELLRSVVHRYSQVHLLSYVGLVGKARRFIDVNYTNPDLSLDIIAGNIGVNASHLSSVFKRESGYSVVEYITACRMERAKAMMDEGGCTMAHVSDTVGFNDPYYFSKCFKKVFGVSPSQYLRTKNM